MVTLLAAIACIEICVTLVERRILTLSGYFETYTIIKSKLNLCGHGFELHVKLN